MVLRGLCRTAAILLPTLASCSSAVDVPLPPDFEITLPQRDAAAWDDAGRFVPSGTAGGGAGGGAGDAGAGTDDGGRPKNKYNMQLLLDGLTVTVNGTAKTGVQFTSPHYWGPDPATAEEFDVSIYFTDYDGVNYFTPTVEIRATRTGAGCERGGNGVVYRNYEGSYAAGETGGCGLSVTSLPFARGDRFSGTFSGTITNYVTGKTKTMTISFGFTRSS